MIARKLVVPADEDPEIALDRAVNLAKSEDYIRHRRQLYGLVDQRMDHQATKRADRVAIEDAVAEISNLAREEFKGGREEIAITCGKVGVGALQAWLGDLTGLASGMLEVLGYAGRPKVPVHTFGQFAMFHDVLAAMKWPQLGFDKD